MVVITTREKDAERPHDSGIVFADNRGMASLYLSLFVMLCLGEQVSVPLSERLRMLDDEDWQVRERATDILVALGPPVLSSVRSALEVAEDPEVRARLGIVERTIFLREQMAFSPAFLERYPDIHRDLARCEGKGEVFRFFKELTMSCSTDPAVTTADVASIIGFLIGDGGEGLTESEVSWVLLNCGGRNRFHFSSKADIRWERPVEEAAPILVKMLGSPDLSRKLRGDVADALLHLKVKTVAGDLLPFLASPLKEIRDDAVMVLGGLDVPEIEPSVVALLSHADAGVRVSALNLLGLLPTREYLGFGPDVDSTCAVGTNRFRFLQYPPKKRHIDKIIPCLDDPDPAVRGMAARALAEKGEYDVLRRHPNFIGLVEELVVDDFVTFEWDLVITSGDGRPYFSSRNEKVLAPLGILPVTSWPSNDQRIPWGTCD